MSDNKAYCSSASQVSTAELCLRKWAFRKIDKIESPPNKYAAFGSRVHKLLEEWFKDGTPPPNTAEGRVARNILGHLPPPQTPGILVERKIDLMLGGVPMVGYVDLSILEGRERPFVSDHKTTSGLQWALAADDMHNDVQCSIYAYEAMVRTNSKTVDVQWTYGTRDGKRSLPVSRKLSLDEIRPRLKRTAETVANLRDIFNEQIPGLELPYDAAGCEAYGGCPYQSICNLTPQERMQSIMSQKNTESAFLAKLRAKKGNGATTPTPHPAPVEPAPDPEIPPSVPTVVNPPSAPETVPEAIEEKPKKRRGRRPKAKTATPAPESPPTPTPLAPSPAPEGVLLSFEQVIDTYRKGFADGFKTAREDS